MPLMPLTPNRAVNSTQGFSLVELLVSLAVLSLLLVLTTEMLSTTQDTWRNSKQRVSQFRDARIAFESITRNLSQATLNTYLDYYDKDGNPMVIKYEGSYGRDDPLQPSYYDRYSELHFLVDYAPSLFRGEDVKTPTHAIFFQAPLGDVRQRDLYGRLNNLLNGRGYFVLLGDDSNSVPDFISKSRDPIHRFRLMEYRPPSEDNRIFSESIDAEALDWFATDAAELIRDSRMIADNVIALVIAPVSTTQDDPARHLIAPDYVYNSRSKRHQRVQFHQLPPLVQVTMVAISEESALQYGIDADTEAAEFVERSGRLFRKAADFDKDLKQLEEDLTELNIDYRVFSATVPIRGAKWSQDVKDLASLPGE
ncbi:MAG: Verru_Chthon cassette protein C [Verrucomicrobiota bacterium]